MNNYYQKDLYAILGISPDSDESKIKAAYRKQARKWHPDVNDNSQESIDKFKEITEAYEVLTDAQKRSQYDILRGINHSKEKNKNTASQTRAQKAYSEQGKNPTKKTYTRTETVGDTPSRKQTANNKEQNSSFSSVFENILDGLFTTDNTKNTKQNKPKTKPENGRDINLNVIIKQPETITGTNRTVNVLHNEKCPKCEGRRFVNGAKCSLCNGKGEISTHKKINVKIPAGVKQNSKIRIANEGNKGYNGGKNGDLYLTIQIEKNSFFQYDGTNVYCEIPITPYEAALGATIDVPTINGCVAMKIPANTTSGQKFRLSGEGIVDKKAKKGDQIVTVKIAMPKEISNEERILYEKLREISKHKVRENLLND